MGSCILEPEINESLGKSSILPLRQIADRKGVIAPLHNAKPSLDCCIVQRAGDLTDPAANPGDKPALYNHRRGLEAVPRFSLINHFGIIEYIPGSEQHSVNYTGGRIDIMPTSCLTGCKSCGKFRYFALDSLALELVKCNSRILGPQSHLNPCW
ncbi:hypothetical protein D3C81_1577070 [compost metagenome]